MIGNLKIKDELPKPSSEHDTNRMASPLAFSFNEKKKLTDTTLSSRLRRYKNPASKEDEKANQAPTKFQFTKYKSKYSKKHSMSNPATRVRSSLQRFNHLTNSITNDNQSSSILSKSQKPYSSKLGSLYQKINKINKKSGEGRMFGNLTSLKRDMNSFSKREVGSNGLQFSTNRIDEENLNEEELVDDSPITFTSHRINPAVPKLNLQNKNFARYLSGSNQPKSSKRNELREKSVGQMMNFSNQKYLNYSNKKLIALPDIHFPDQDYELINFKGNQFDHIPGEIAQIKSIKYLDFNCNLLPRLTLQDLDTLKNVEYLGLEWAKLATMLDSVATPRKDARYSTDRTNFADSKRMHEPSTTRLNSSGFSEAWSNSETNTTQRYNRAQKVIGNLNPMDYDKESFIQLGTLHQIFKHFGKNWIDFLDYYCWKTHKNDVNAFGESHMGAKLIEKAKFLSFENKWKGIILAVYQRDFKSTGYLWNLISKEGVKRVIQYGNPYLFQKVVFEGCQKGQFKGEKILCVLGEGIKRGIVKKSILKSLIEDGHLNINQCDGGGNNLLHHMMIYFETKDKQCKEVCKYLLKNG